MSRLTRRGVLSGGFSSLVVTLSPTSLSGAATGSSVTTSGSVAMSASGGSGSYTYAWERVSGSTALSANNPSSSSTTFTATGMSELETRSAVWRGKVTDSTTGVEAYTDNTVTVSLTRNQAALSASLSPASLEGSGQGTTVTTSGSVTVTATGGSGSYSYAWERVSGATQPAPVNATSASTAFSTSSIATGANQSAVWRCVVTDTVNLTSTVTGNVTISLTRGYDSLVVSVAPSALSGVGNGATVVTSGSATATVTGGSGSWTGVWLWDEGTSTGSIVPTNLNNPTTTFQSGDAQSPGTSRSAGFRFRVTDSVTGAVATSPTSVVSTLTRYATLSASASPASLSGTGDNTPVVTSGSATCTASGGSGSYSYFWEWDQGAATGSIVPTTGTSASTTFQSGDAQASGTTRTAGFRCRVRDTVTNDVVVTSSVAISLSRNYAGMSVSVSPSALSGAGTGSSVESSGPATVSVSGGSGNFEYFWVYDGTGTGGINPLNFYAGSTAFASTNDHAAGTTRTAGFYCHVKDVVTNETKNTASVSISLTRNYAALSASLSPASLSGSGTGATVTTSGNVAVTVTGGSGSFTYAWERVSGSTVPTPTAGASASTGFSTSSISAGQTQSAVWRCVVTDTVTTNTATTGNVSISLTRSGISTATVSPETQNWPETAPYQVFATVNHDGVGPFTYNWIADPSIGITITSPTSPSTSISSTNGTGSITITCRVTDNGAGGSFLDASGVILDGFN